MEAQAANGATCNTLTNVADRQDLTRLRRTTEKKKKLTDEEILLQISMSSSLCIIGCIANQCSLL